MDDLDDNPVHSDTTPQSNNYTLLATTYVGLYGNRHLERLFPGLAPLACRCSEKDAEIKNLKTNVDELFRALRNRSDEVISMRETRSEWERRMNEREHAVEKRESDMDCQQAIVAQRAAANVSQEDKLRVERESLERRERMNNNVLRQWAEERERVEEENSAARDSLARERKKVEQDRLNFEERREQHEDEMRLLQSRLDKLKTSLRDTELETASRVEKLELAEQNLRKREEDAIRRDKELDASKLLIAEELEELSRRTATVTSREQQITSSETVWSRTLHQQKTQLIGAQRSLLRYQAVFALVSSYMIDHARILETDLVRQKEVFSRTQRLEKENMETSAKENTDRIIREAEKSAKVILEEAEKQANEILIQVHRNAAARSLTSGRSSPTFSEDSVSAYSLRSFESMPILPEETGNYSHNTRTRRASIDGSQNNKSGIRRKPIPAFEDEILSSEFGATPQGSEVPVFSKGERRRRTSLQRIATSFEEDIFGENQSQAPRKRTVSRKGKEIEGVPKTWKPY